MIEVSKTDWDKIPNGYKGKWEAFGGCHPEWLGRKTVLSGCISEEKGALLIEGVHFTIKQN